jgi:hypothetical protein
VRITRRRGGIVRVQFGPGETEGLELLFGELAELIRDGSPDDPAISRLFPAAYLDDEQAAEFRELTESGLRDERLERLDACRGELADDRLELDRDAATRWIKTLNDFRLAAGTRLGITEDDDGADPRGADAPQREIYSWVTWFQDSLVRALMA